MSLRQKLLDIQKSLTLLLKDKQGTNHRYVSGTVVLHAIREQMDNLSISLEPHITPGSTKTFFMDYDVKQKIVNDKWVGRPQRDIVVVSEGSWVWVDNETGETVSVLWLFVGQQSDAAQAFGSALTYGERYFILKYFHIPTDELDPDHTKAGKIQEDETTITFLSEEIYQDVLKSADVEKLKKVYKEYSTPEKMMMPYQREKFDGILVALNEKI